MPLSAYCRPCCTSALALHLPFANATPCCRRPLCAAEVLAEDPPEEGQSKADAAYDFMRHVSAVLFWWQFDIWEIGLRKRESQLTTASLTIPPSLHLAVVDMHLSALYEAMGRSTRTQLSLLPLRMLMEIHYHLSIAKARLYSCTGTEVALIEAAETFFRIESGRHLLQPSRGAKRAANKALRDEQERATVAAAAAALRAEVAAIQDLTTSDADHCYALGLQALEAGDLAKAEQHFLRTIAAAPLSWEPHVALATIMARQGCHEAAKRHNAHAAVNKKAQQCNDAGMSQEQTDAVTADMTQVYIEAAALSYPHLSQALSGAASSSNGGSGDGQDGGGCNGEGGVTLVAPPADANVEATVDVPPDAAAASAGSAASAASTVDPEGEPKWFSLRNIWRRVACAYKKATEIAAVLRMLSVPTTHKDGSRLRRIELQTAFASTLSKRNDPVTQAMIRRLATRFTPSQQAGLEQLAELSAAREEAEEARARGEELSPEQHHTLGEWSRVVDTLGFTAEVLASVGIRP